MNLLWLVYGGWIAQFLLDVVKIDALDNILNFLEMLIWSLVAFLDVRRLVYAQIRNLTEFLLRFRWVVLSTICAYVAKDSEIEHRFEQDAARLFQYVSCTSVDFFRRLHPVWPVFEYAFADSATWTHR